MAALVRVGTSGWEYRHWAGSFYPRGLPRHRWFDHYAAQFDTVELNNPFYRLPQPSVFDLWRRRAPPGFIYAVKASRYLTHIKRLREPEEPLDRLWTRASRLAEHLGPVLYQLPPRWKPNPDRLARFLRRVPPAPQAIEFRDARWYAPDILSLVDGAGVALCLHDMDGAAAAPERIGPFVYIRFHGAGTRYGGRYSSQRLSAWADRIAAWSSEGLPVWVYFNNDEGGHAVRDADRLRDMVARRGD